MHSSTLLSLSPPGNIGKFIMVICSRCVCSSTGTYNGEGIKYNVTSPCTSCPTGMTTAATGSTNVSECYSKSCMPP